MSSPTSTTLRDAKKPLLLKITKTDIARSKRNDPKHCMIAESCIRLTGADEVRIHKSRAYVRKGDAWTRYIVPEFAARELLIFDRGGENPEFETILRPPAEYDKLGSYGSRTEHGKGKRNRTGRTRPLIRTHGVRSDMTANIHVELGA